MNSTVREITCEYCGSKSSTTDRKKRFCNRSCSASFNNRKSPKRRSVPKQCVDCSVEHARRSKRCAECADKRRIDWTTVTIGELHYRAEYQRSAHIRTNARNVLRDSGAVKACRVCGYDAHVEVSHIVAINTFPTTTPVAVVNALSNLEYLCPNHHWEHDAGILHP